MSTLQQIKGHVSSILKLDATPGSEDDVQLTESIDMVGRRLWQMYPWPERVQDVTVLTSAVYSTGTATFTLDSTTLTGSGTTWSGFAGRKVARGWNLPWYRVLTNGGVTSIVLARAFKEATASASAYVVYQDEIDVATDVDTIQSCHLIVDGRRGPVVAVGRAVMDDASIVQSGTGKPRYVSLVLSQTTGTKRVRVTPVPDAIYAMQVVYHRSWSDLTNPNADIVFDENRRWLLTEGALLYGQRLSAAKQQSSESQLIALASRAWLDAQSHAPIVFQREPWGGRGGGITPNVSITVT